MGDDVYLIDEWLRFANMDLDLAKHSFATMHPAPLEIICYHCQQAAEKFLKSVFIYFNITVIKTHNLPLLVTTLLDYIDVPSEIDDYAENLTQFSTKSRYPQAIELDEGTTKNAIAQAEQVKIWAEKIIAEKSSDQNNKEDDTTNNPMD